MSGSWRIIPGSLAVVARHPAAARRHFCTRHSHPGAPACTPTVCRSYCGTTYHGEPVSDAGPRRRVPADTCPVCFDAWNLETVGSAA